MFIFDKHKESITKSDKSSLPRTPEYAHFAPRLDAVISARPVNPPTSLFLSPAPPCPPAPLPLNPLKNYHWLETNFEFKK